MGGTRRRPLRGGGAGASRSAAPKHEQQPQQRQQEKRPQVQQPQAAPRVPRGGASTLAPGSEAAEAEVLSAISSLYDDELRPYGRIVRKRLAERRQQRSAEEAGGSAVAAITEPSSQDLRGVCERCMRLHVEPEEGGEWSALLLDRDPAFVDIYSDEDTYPPELWEAAAEYFEGLAQGGTASSSSSKAGRGGGSGAGGAAGAASAALPGGRYASARELMARRPAFLKGRSFGQVCHIMQLAISQKSLLGYFNGAIVPYEHSTSMVKRRCAEEQRPCGGAGSVCGLDQAGASGFQVADWGTARRCLRDIMQEAVSSGANQVPLSNIKRLFRSKFQAELSETALGHAKISKLLQDPHFRDICDVELQDRGYAVVPAPLGTKPLEEPAEEEVAHLHEEHRSVVIQEAANAPRRCPPIEVPADAASAPQTPVRAGGAASHRWAALSPFTVSKEGSVGSIVQRTFIHAALPPPTPTGPAASRRSLSLPKDLGSGRDDWEAACHALSFLSQPLDSRRPDQAGNGGSGTAPLAAAAAAAKATPLEMEHRHYRFDPAHPLCLEDAAQPRLATFCAMASSECGGCAPTYSREPPARALFCPGEPLHLEDLEEAVESPEVFLARTPSPQWAASRYLLGPRSAASAPEPRVVNLATLLGVPGGERAP